MPLTPLQHFLFGEKAQQELKRTPEIQTDEAEPKQISCEDRGTSVNEKNQPEFPTLKAVVHTLQLKLLQI